MAQKRIAAVLVTSYIGISPRAANHAYELAEAGYDQVYFVGQKDAKTYQKVETHPKIRIVGIPFGWVKVVQKLPNIIYFLLRVLIHTLILIWLFFFYLKTPEVIIVQNPPSIPVLSFLWLLKLFKRKTKVIIDVHNYGYTLMFKTKSKKMLDFCRWYEQYFIRKVADVALTVSEEMKKDIMKNWGVKKAVVCYDKSNSEVFKPLSLEQKHEFFAGFQEFNGKSDQVTRFTKSNSDGTHVEYLENRPLLLITSTTYTEDEKIEYLFSAMVEYEKMCHQLEGQGKKPRHLVLVVTGSGERKKIYQEMIKENRYKWKYISIEMIWFKPDDYPKMIACADVGICLHYSSSGYDLPMKVVDMYGTGLPAIAANYITIGELVENGKTGLLFNSEKELFEYIKEIGTNWETFEKKWNEMRKNVAKFRETSFGQEWKQKVQPLLPISKSRAGEDGEELRNLKKED